jgi:hypothetical protein
MIIKFLFYGFYFFSVSTNFFLLITLYDKHIPVRGKKILTTGSL